MAEQKKPDLGTLQKALDKAQENHDAASARKRCADHEETEAKNALSKAMKDLDEALAQLRDAHNCWGTQWDARREQRRAVREVSVVAG